jgi:aminoglycoside phosphotransferase (APT) family kinase protein
LKVPPEGQLAAAERIAQQLFPHARTLNVSRVLDGGSTWVYRIDQFDQFDQSDNTFYLRVLPEADASFAPEVFVHNALRMRGVHVPEVIHFEHYHEEFQRSLVVTTAIAGVPVARAASPEVMAPVLREAGRELALLNQLPVNGFGWVQRDCSSVYELRGEHSTFADWAMTESVPAVAMVARHGLLTEAQVARLELTVALTLEQFQHEPATLAHGDFDLTHIFYKEGRYTGIIDFGEIRGTNGLYDLGHFAIENAHALPLLLAGYGEIASLPENYAEQIQLTALLVALQRTGRRLARAARALKADLQTIFLAFASRLHW